MFGLQQGSKRPVCLLTTASPVQEDLQRSGKQSPQEEPTQFLLHQDSEQHGEEQHHLQYNQKQHPTTYQQATWPVKVVTDRDVWKGAREVKLVTRFN